jgi:hypothetical protein
MIDTPVVLIIFRRPDLTARVLEAVAAVKPRQLFVFADGPRSDRPEDAEACIAARAVIERVDWECDVHRYYSDVNLGCGRGPATGISWAFEHVEQAIVLEDDCVPHPSFFRFCGELLERYRDDQRVMHIAGSIYREQPLTTPHSYVFSQFNCAWGWATWRRAWSYFDATVALWPALRQTSWLRDVVGDPNAVRYWANEFDVANQRAGDVSYWDHQWTFACWANSGLSVVPRVNLVSNVGCGPNGTHTLWEADPIGNLPTCEMDFPLAHPPAVLQSRERDREFLREVILPRLVAPEVSAMRVLASRVAPDFVKRGVRQLAAAVRPVLAR